MASLDPSALRRGDATELIFLEFCVPGVAAGGGAGRGDRPRTRRATGAVGVAIEDRRLKRIRPPRSARKR